MRKREVIAEPTEAEEFLDLALDRFKLAAQSEARSRRESLDDLEFSIGNQWPQNIQAQRQLDGKPCLTMNRLPQFIRQVTNEQRQQRPSIQINPIGDGADVDTAEIFEGVIRHIEVNSHAEEAYDTGFDFMVRIGFGCWRILTDWIAQEVEDQELYIVPIDNPFTVYLDPTNQRDPSWGFIIEDLLAREFKRQFPRSRYGGGSANLSEYESVGDMPANWATAINGEPAIRIAEYFYIEKSSGDKGRENRKVYWSKISGLDILDGNEERTAGKLWPGKYIPIVKEWADNIVVNGDRQISGLVRYAKDAQRAYNYWMSAATEKIALSSKAPWVVAEGQLEGYEQMWAQANYRNQAFLTYKQVDAIGKPAPPPERQLDEPRIQGMTEMLQLAVQDFQATTGIYPNNLGEKQTAGESGKAVLARQKQGDIATLNYSDNHARGIERTGTILLDLIPKVYTSARIQRIVKPDGKPKMVGLYNSKNGETSDDVAKHPDFNEEIKRIYDIGTGRYDVAVSVGPSYQSKRQEAVASQIALIQAFPQSFTVIGDKIVRNMDWPGAEQIADRLYKAMVNQIPALADDDEQGGPEGELMKTKQQLAQMAQQHQLLTQQLQKATEIINTKQVEQQAKIAVSKMQEDSRQAIVKLQEDSRQAIVKLQEATKIAVAQINASKDTQEGIADRELEQYGLLHDAAHDIALQHHQQQHEKDLAAQEAAQAQQQQASDQAHESQTQGADQVHEQQMQQSDQSAQMAMQAQKPENGAGE